MSESALLLDHNHPTQTPSQNKLFAKLELLCMILELGKSFRTPPQHCGDHAQAWIAQQWGKTIDHLFVVNGATVMSVGTRPCSDK